MIDHVGIYGSRVAEGLSAFNVGLVSYIILLNPLQYNFYYFDNLDQHYSNWTNAVRYNLTNISYLPNSYEMSIYLNLL